MCPVVCGQCPSEEVMFAGLHVTGLKSVQQTPGEERDSVVLRELSINERIVDDQKVGMGHRNKLHAGAKRSRMEMLFFSPSNK